MTAHQQHPTPPTESVAGLGISLTGHDKVVALAGNPNTGKSTVFNRLTGLRQHTGNWPGKTVARAEGSFAHRGLRYKLVDLPGTYSLLSASIDEEIARDFILFGRPNCVLVLTDATALERNLNLVFQVLEITDRVVVCVNLMDEAARKGLTVNAEQLSADLGVPAVCTTARTGAGFDDLLDAIDGVVTGRIETSPHCPPPPPELRQAVEQLTPLIEQVAPGVPNGRWIAYRLLEGDHRVRQALLACEFGQVVAQQAAPPSPDPTPI
ncbi:MAG TPA: FeoB small GTPase domain-containing protein [Phycisphaerae bacterium]|nr:FeoB small GTPase domain-containing protein [Phycisphaerae bacterium]